MDEAHERALRAGRLTVKDFVKWQATKGMEETKSARLTALRLGIDRRKVMSSLDPEVREKLFGKKKPDQ